MTIHPRAAFDFAQGGITLNGLTITQDSVVQEARHWAAGSRGEPVDLETLQAADLSPFVEQALTVGSVALSTAGGTQQAYGIDKLVAEAEQRTAQTAKAAAEQTEQAVRTASEALTRTSLDTATKVSAAVEGGTKRLTDQVAALLGGEDPALLLRLQPLLEKAMADTKARTLAETDKLLEKVARQFNPADPASPMAVQLRTLTEAQAAQLKGVTEQQAAIAAQVQELVTAFQAKATRDSLVAATPLKGAAYEEQVHAVLREIAAGLGDEYVETGDVIGLKSRNKKGDGVLSLQAGDVKVVVEMTDSRRTSWADYLRDAEENRGALASLGLARSRDLLAGQTLMTLGPRRLVLAFDPETDDPQLVRCAVQLLRQAAEMAAARVDSGELASAEEALSEALRTLATLDQFKGHTDAIRKGANAIETKASTLQTELLRLLTAAKTALAGASAAAVKDAA